MSRWPIKQLGALCSVVNERAIEGTVPYLEIGNLDTKTKEYELTDKPAVKGALIARAGDVIVSKVRPTRGAITSLRDKQLAVSSAFTILRSRNDVTTKFLFFALAWNNEFLTYLGRCSKGALYPTVPEKDVLSFEITVPPILEQERIAKLLDEADGLRKQRAQSNRLIAALIPAIFHEMFGDPVANPMKWPIETLGEVLELSRERVEPAEHPEMSFNYIGLETIESHTGSLIPYQSTLGAEIKSTKNVFHRGEILYGKLRPYLNKVYLADRDGICSTDIYVFRPREGKIHQSFAEIYLRSSFVLSVASNAMTGANLPRIGQDALFGIEIPIPPLPLQKDFARRVTEIRAVQAEQAASRKRLDDLFQSMLHRAFNGEL